MIKKDLVKKGLEMLPGIAEKHDDHEKFYEQSGVGEVAVGDVPNFEVAGGDEAKEEALTARDILHLQLRFERERRAEEASKMEAVD